jgi:hypothetical protein
MRQHQRLQLADASQRRGRVRSRRCRVVGPCHYTCGMGEVRLRNGTRLWGGGSVSCARDGRLVDVRIRDLTLGDWVALPYGEGFGRLPQALLPMPLSAAYGSQKTIRLPFVMDNELALLLGMYASEGHTTPSNYSIIITNSEEVVLERCVQLWQSTFGLRARITRQRGRCPGVVVSSKSAMEFMSNLGCGRRASDKRIPRAVMDSPEPVVLSYLRGLALDAYTSATGPSIKWAICVDSPSLLDDLQLLLRRLGLMSGRIAKYNREYDKSFDEVYLAGREAQRFVELVPFLEPGKRAAAERLSARELSECRNGADVVPLVHGSSLYADIPKGTGGRSGTGTGVAVKWRSLTDKRTLWPSRHLVERLAEAAHRLPSDVQRVLDENLRFSPVTAASA